MNYNKTYRLASVGHPTLRNKLARALWSFVWLFLFRPSPRPFHGWRCLLLRLFGAQIGKPAYVYPSSWIWAPWNLELGDYSTLADRVDCYCVDKVVIGSYSTVSQYSFLCTASHDYIDPIIMKQPQMPLTTAPITIGDRVWIAADVFIAPGISLADGVVIHARSTVLKDISAWSVASGFPATVIKRRILRTL